MKIKHFTLTAILILTMMNQAFGSGSGEMFIPVSDTVETDREYTLRATMIGYTGMGGIFDGVLNPVLVAERGEIVKITIINGELMPHDIALENLGISSDIIIEEGVSTYIIFEAIEDDTYYCTIPGHRESGMEGQFRVSDDLSSEELISGVLPQRDGKPLNLDFESGTLEHWTMEGDAFEGQPVPRDPSPLHDDEMNIGHSGQYFITSGGTLEYEKTGTLTSIPFGVTHPYAAFYVSGGALQDTRVELVDVATDHVFFKISGNNHAALRPVVINLQSRMGDEIYIRIVDHETGESEIPYIRPDIWAHISFDNFRFYPERPVFQNELHPDDIFVLPPRDLIPNAGLSGAEAAAAMELPDGFSVTLAAAEPDITRPIAFAMDDRGRLWVAEGHTYPLRAPEGAGEDRILIFEDTTGDGKFDNRTVFMEGLNLVSGLEVGFDGVWVGAAPYFMYIPIDETGSQPAGDPEILLDGWGYQDTHETLNSFQWGPDGWLYGVHGVFTHSNVGKPGAGKEDRQRINAGIWRYHPQRHDFEVYAHGTSNPWGIDFNDMGHAFTTVCVIPHLFHVIQGARYHRQAGEHFNPYTYNDIKTIADHVHWVGERGPHAGNFRSADQGGGHAHAGAMFYLGNEHWELDRNAIFMNNIHGYRVNSDHLVRSGSGYTAVHGDDFLLTNDSWSQWLNFRIGPDGSVYAIDWYDKNQCHSPNPDVHDKTLGRIFKISHVKDEWVQPDLTEKSSLELVELQLHQNDWYVRHSRRILQERGPDTQVHEALMEILTDHTDITRKLRALWALHVTAGLTTEDLLRLMEHENEYMRGWAIKLLMEKESPSDPVLHRFAEMAETDESALVRLHIASALQKIEPVSRWAILKGLYSRNEDADDHNLPLMIWYAAEPAIETDLNTALRLADKTRLPNLLTYTIQRIGAIGTKQAMQVLASHKQNLGDSQREHEIHIMIDRILAENEFIIHTFEKIQLSSTFYAEGVAIGDVSGNGQNDVVCGPYWYEGPDFENRFAYYEPAPFDPLQYSENFIVAVEDVNGNSLNDILIVGFPGREAYWYENPGESNEYWPRHLIHPNVDNESPSFVDLTGDDQLDLVFHSEGRLGYAARNSEDPASPWNFYPVSEPGNWGHFNHGLGIGDITGNGYSDLMMADGWWENPGEFESDSTWEYHAVDFGPGGAQMFAWDIDGDGLNDVVTSLEAHGWGLAWFRQVRNGDEIRFEKELIMGDSHDDNPYGVRFSQPHALEIADLNGNGELDLLTGKRFWAHGPDGDPEPNAPAVIYWFRPVTDESGQTEFIPHLIDDDSGVGTQIATGDLTGNGLPDIATCNKKGGFVFLNRAEAASREQ